MPANHELHPSQKDGGLETHARPGSRLGSTAHPATWGPHRVPVLIAIARVACFSHSLHFSQIHADLQAPFTDNHPRALPSPVKKERANKSRSVTVRHSTWSEQSRLEVAWRGNRGDRPAGARTTLPGEVFCHGQRPVPDVLGIMTVPSRAHRGSAIERNHTNKH